MKESSRVDKSLIGDDNDWLSQELRRERRIALSMNAFSKSASEVRKMHNDNCAAENVRLEHENNCEANYVRTQHTMQHYNGTNAKNNSLNKRSALAIIIFVIIFFIVVALPIIFEILDSISNGFYYYY